jgi:uncharacterized membrane protein YdjX (TVP38/TMEM64 family)
MTFFRRSRWRPSGRIILAVCLAALIAFGILVTWASPQQATDAAESLMHILRGLGFRGAVLYAALQICVAVSGLLPASLLGVAAGAIYGFVPGFLLAATSTLAGALLSFLLSHSVFRPTVEKLVARHPRLRNLDALIARDGWRLVCLLRVSPVMPFSATSFILGLSPIGLRDYAIGTLASLPALCGYVFIGTLADTGVSAWSSGAGPVRWGLLGIGALATLLLILRLGQIVVKLGLATSARDDLGLAGEAAATGPQSAGWSGRGGHE